jgi:hypothetical protein
MAGLVPATHDFTRRPLSFCLGWQCASGPIPPAASLRSDKSAHKIKEQWCKSGGTIRLICITTTHRDFSRCLAAGARRINRIPL